MCPSSADFLRILSPRFQTRDLLWRIARFVEVFAGGLSPKQVGIRTVIPR
jgi:hypothetical protein